MAVNHLLVSFLFLLTFKTGFSAEIPVFVKTGDSVQLDIQTQKLPEFDDLSWRNDTSKNIVRYISGTKKVRLPPSYKDRVDFNNETFSLTLKNMQKRDSGLYTATTTVDVDTIIVTYRVSVIDAVDSPVLTVNTHWSSSDSCTVNFTCRAHDLTINSSYPNNSCSPEEVTSHVNYTLILHCSEESIICNHSNTVSWKIDRINITQLCVKGNDKTKSALQSWPHISVAVAVVAVCLLAIAVFLCWKCLKGAQEASTVYAQVETLEMAKTNSDGHTYDVPERVQDQTQEQTGDNRPNTTYCTVGQHQKPAAPVETDHTIYSTVCKQPTKKPTKEPPTISSDDK